jgi:retron-type reverse transcriptase
VFEKLFYNRLISFINNHNILHPHQFGFRANHSISLALAHVLSSIIDKINSKKRVVLALLDLKKAFDLVNHNLLLKKLCHYGIRGIPLKWLTSYLTNRYQSTKVNGNYSDYKEISAGVPQGSILGPLLFILFVNDVFQFNSIHVELYLYADDTAIIFHAENNELLQNIINNFFSLYCEWCDVNCIVLNPSKSNYLSFNNSSVSVIVNGQSLQL